MIITLKLINEVEKLCKQVKKDKPVQQYDIDTLKACLAFFKSAYTLNINLYSEQTSSIALKLKNIADNNPKYTNDLLTIGRI